MFFPVILTVAFVATVWILAQQIRRQQHLKMTFDLNNRLLDRSSMKEFSDFLQTEQGTKFVETLTVQREASAPSDGILRAIRTGTILTTLGIGFLFLGEYLRSEGREVLTAAGVISLSLGVGFLISSRASYRLARTLGVLPGNAEEKRTP